MDAGVSSRILCCKGLAPEPLLVAQLAHEALLHLATARAHGLEHLAHLLVLAEQVVDLLHGGS